MQVMITHTKIKPEKVPQVSRSARELFTALRAAAPDVRVETSLLADGVTFVTILHLEDGTENPLPSLPVYRDFLDGLRPCLSEPPAVARGAIVAEYAPVGPAERRLAS